MLWVNLENIISYFQTITIILFQPQFLVKSKSVRRLWRDKGGPMKQLPCLKNRKSTKFGNSSEWKNIHRTTKTNYINLCTVKKKYTQLAFWCKNGWFNSKSRK